MIRLGGAGLIIGVGGTRLITEVGGARVNYWGWRVQLIARTGEAQLITSGTHCYSGGSGEGGVAPSPVSSPGGEGKWGFSSARKFPSNPPGTG